MKLINPDTIARPGSTYSHGALVPGAAERLAAPGRTFLRCWKRPG
jgi:hypothetical protein